MPGLELTVVRANTTSGAVLVAPAELTVTVDPVPPPESAPPTWSSLVIPVQSSATKPHAFPWLTATVMTSPGFSAVVTWAVAMAVVDFGADGDDVARTVSTR